MRLQKYVTKAVAPSGVGAMAAAGRVGSGTVAGSVADVDTAGAELVTGGPDEPEVHPVASIATAATTTSPRLLHVNNRVPPVQVRPN
jgi:hypothetical protein